MSWKPTIVGGPEKAPGAEHPLPSIGTDYCGYRRRKARNPLRLHVDHVRKAVTEANKLEHDPDDVELIRRGAESARLLADALTRAAGGAQSPKKAAASEVVPASDHNSGHAEAFRDLESEICDLHRWAELAYRLMTECACDQRSWRELELVVLVVVQLRDFAGEFRNRYYKAWKDTPENCS